MNKNKYLRSITAVALMVACAHAQAQGSPAKPVRMVVGFAPGGSTDVVARILSRKLTDNLGQPFVVENRAGASSNIAAQTVARAPADGLTLLYATSTLTVNVSLFNTLPFDLQKDFVAVAPVADIPSFLTVHASLPVKTVKELVALAKKHPDEILYASIGNGTPAHLSAELFNSMAGIRMTHVPYKGAAASIVALISGETQLTFTTVLVAMPHIKSGRLRALGVASLKRSTVLPDVPTIDEAGVRGYESNAWYGLLAPARTPQPILDQLHRETVKTLQNNDVRDNLKGQGAEPVGNAPREFAVIIADEIEKWRRVVLATGARAD